MTVVQHLKSLSGPRRASLWVLLGVLAAFATNGRSIIGKATSDPTDPSALPLLTAQDLVYAGAFRMPEGRYDYGGTALAYWPAHNSLLIVGHDWYQEASEISIPSPSTASTLAQLPRASVIQPLTDILKGRRTSIDGDTGNGVKIGGLLPFGDKIVVTAWSFYDAGGSTQTLTHFLTGQDFANLGDVTGPYQVGTGYSPNTIGGFVSGYMTPIPSAWRPLLGGSHLTGQNGIAIVGRTSLGPSANVFNPADLGVTVPAPAIKVLGYPITHPTLGEYNVGGGAGLFNGTQAFRGIAFPDGTRSVLFIGQGGSRFCYGAATADPSLDFKPMPDYPDAHYCFDPMTLGDKGVTGYPYKSLIYAYDANDLVAVKNGLKQPWEILPYATWPLSLPFQARFADLGYGSVDVGSRVITGAAYDPVSHRLFVAAYKSDDMLPLIHVFIVNAPSSSAKRLCFF